MLFCCQLLSAVAAHNTTKMISGSSLDAGLDAAAAVDVRISEGMKATKPKGEGFDDAVDDAVSEIERLKLDLSSLRSQNKNLKKQIVDLELTLEKKNDWSDRAKEYIANRDMLTSELLLEIGKINPEIRKKVTPGLNYCNFCFYVVKKDEGGGFCPCRKVGYCSKTCQELDWKRRHKYSCSLGFLRGGNLGTKDSDLYHGEELSSVGSGSCSENECMEDPFGQIHDEEPPSLTSDDEESEKCELELID